MEMLAGILVLILMFWIMPALFVSSEIGTGNKAYSMTICLLLGPVGIIIILIIEYAKTVFQPEQETP
ncbi:hypothetical protein [Gimesia algae]|uniref:Uncharacterized protein n=1 Tax=Gimesia algae TaxID=2527971 RepID=A0A517V831_9PLAN|nr:hypothetical protein [Gimesia algae]QDT89171.1 hypothetical protein Pan161_07970 [Gimesia algae]